MDGVKFQYFTEIDLIQRYAAKRKMPIEEVEDLYTALRKWLIFKLNDTSLTPQTGYYIDNFFMFSHHHLVIDNLKKVKDNPKYKRAEQQLLFYLSGKQRLKIK
jgi:hypothetical protein